MKISINALWKKEAGKQYLRKLYFQRFQFKKISLFAKNVNFKQKNLKKPPNLAPDAH